MNLHVYLVYFDQTLPSTFSKEDKDEEDNEFALLEKAAMERMRKMGDEARRGWHFGYKNRDVLYDISIIYILLIYLST